METYSADESETEKHPIVFENPDGSLVHGLPTGMRYKKPQCDAEIAVVVESAYNRHEKILSCFLFLNFILEISFIELIQKFKTETVSEILTTHPFITPVWAHISFWLLIAINYLFLIVFYSIGWLAIYDRQLAWMRALSELSLVGILFQSVFALINRFNLILFFIRFSIFGYSKYLTSILSGTARLNRFDDRIVLDV